MMSIFYFFFVCPTNILLTAYYILLLRYIFCIVLLLLLVQRVPHRVPYQTSQASVTQYWIPKSSKKDNNKKITRVAKQYHDFHRQVPVHAHKKNGECPNKLVAQPTQLEAFGARCTGKCYKLRWKVQHARFGGGQAGHIQCHEDVSRLVARGLRSLRAFLYSHGVA